MAGFVSSKRLPQARLAGLALTDKVRASPRFAIVPEARFPVPRLEVIANSPISPFSPKIEHVIPIGELFMSGAGVLSATKPDASSHGDRNPVNQPRRISYCERIKRIDNWHTDTGGAKPYGDSRPA